MYVDMTLKAWPTQRSRSSNHSAHTALLTEGLNVHKKTPKHTYTHTQMSLTVHAPTQLVSAECHASLSVHKEFVFFF